MFLLSRPGRSRRTIPPGCDSGVKVFWFFFSKKNCLPCLSLALVKNIAQETAPSMQHGSRRRRAKLTASIIAVAFVANAHVSRAASTPRIAVAATVGKDGKSVRVIFANGPDLVVVMEDTGAVMFDAPIIAADGRTVAWSEDLQMAASYPDAATLYIYRDGEPFVFQRPDQAKVGIMDGCPDGGTMLDWHFYENGRQLYMACGFAHGQAHAYRSLYDLDTGRRLGKVDVSDDTDAPPPGAPAWARSTSP